jgi:cytochrome c553
MAAPSTISESRMTDLRILGVAALLAAATVFAQAPTSSTAAPADATVTPLPSTPPTPMAVLTDAHALARPGDAKVGQTKAAACGACHGLDGNSSNAQYPKLAAQHERYIARQLALFKTGERENPIMMGMSAAVTPQDMRDIGAYFASQKVLAGVSDDSVIKDGPNKGTKFYAVGERLYRGGDAARGVPACMACHGPTGAGNPGPAYPNLGGQHATYISAKLTAFRGGLILGKGDYANAVMAGVAKGLTDEEIQALATYVNGLHAAHDDVANKSVASAATTAPAAAVPAPAASVAPARPTQH